MDSSIILPSCISYLENDIEISTLEEAMKFELLMEMYKKYNFLEISEAFDKIDILLKKKNI